MKTFNHVYKLNEDHTAISPDLLDMRILDVLEVLEDSPEDDAIELYDSLVNSLTLLDVMLQQDGYASDNKLGEPNTVEQNDFPELDEVPNEFPTFGGMESGSNKGGIDNFKFDD